ncbi:hypothetical protein, partial [Escherichia coli]
MSSLNIKQGGDAHFSEYPLASPSNNEIDLLRAYPNRVLFQTMTPQAK